MNENPTGIQIHQYRPERMFGQAFVIWKWDWVSGKRLSLHFKDGLAYWKVHDDNHTALESLPPEERWTFILDDEVVTALAENLQRTRPVQPEKNIVEHITTSYHDARFMRDRMVDMVEKLTDRTGGDTYATYYQGTGLDNEKSNSADDDPWADEREDTREELEELRRQVRNLKMELRAHEVRKRQREEADHQEGMEPPHD